MDTLATSPIDSGPVTQTERIQSLDVLRGVAVLGILVMNIQAFAMIGAAYMNPTAYGDLTGVNYWVWLLGHVFTDQKFMTVFSMLFGAGIVLMTSRREQATGRSAGVHYRRMGILLIFGVLHAYLLWFGDVLFHYAMCGFLVYLFRRWRPISLLAVAVPAIAFASAISLLFGWSMTYWPPEAIEGFMKEWAPTQEVVAEQVAVYQGSWLEQMPHRTLTSLMMQTFLFLIAILWRTGGVMLVGVALFKWGVFSAKRSAGTYLILVAVGVFIGVPLILHGVHRNEAAGWDLKYSFFLGSQFNYWASILVALAWVGLVMLVCRSRSTKWITRPFAAAGQMAFTNYLLQTIICTTIFYGHGFGFFGKVERVELIAIVFAVWVFELILSLAWLHYFRFGPFEWIWRSLTYRKAQPMVRKASARPASDTGS